MHLVEILCHIDQERRLEDAAAACVIPLVLDLAPLADRPVAPVPVHTQRDHVPPRLQVQNAADEADELGEYRDNAAAIWHVWRAVASY
jgi:hypothetical protein